MKKRILLVEDEESLRELIKLNLELENYVVTVSNNGFEALSKFKNQQFDLILLDVMLPAVNGFEICESIRLVNSSVPIIFLSAKNTAEDRIEGLKKGGDDYIVKPFNLEELIIRIQKQLDKRQMNFRITDQIDCCKIGSWDVDFLSFEAKNRQCKKIKLGHKEGLMLQLLLKNKNQVLSRETIQEKVWGHAAFSSPRMIDNYIMNFRKYFEIDSKAPQYFLSIRGLGYKYSDE